MGLKSQLSSGNRLPAFSVQAGETATIMVDCDKDAREVPLHPTVKPGGGCTGAGCKLCAAGLPRKVKRVVVAHQLTAAGEWAPVAVWLSDIDGEKFGAVLPDTGKAIVIVTGAPVIGDNGKPKAGPSGRLWVDLTYTLDRQDSARKPAISVDGEVLAGEAGIH